MGNVRDLDGEVPATDSTTHVTPAPTTFVRRVGHGWALQTPSFYVWDENPREIWDWYRALARTTPRLQPENRSAPQGSADRTFLPVF